VALVARDTTSHLALKRVDNKRIVLLFVDPPRTISNSGVVRAIADDMCDFRPLLHSVQVFMNAVKHRVQQLLAVLLLEPTEHSSV
jgi:hypothetical protein